MTLIDNGIFCEMFELFVYNMLAIMFIIGTERNRS